LTTEIAESYDAFFSCSSEVAITENGRFIFVQDVIRAMTEKIEISVFMQLL
jgi:hypothetical protein